MTTDITTWSTPAGAEDLDAADVLALLKAFVTDRTVTSIRIESEGGKVQEFTRPGSEIRWREKPNARWKPGRLLRINGDIADFTDTARGASRTKTIDHIEIRTVGPRGGAIWIPLAESDLH